MSLSLSKVEKGRPWWYVMESPGGEMKRVGAQKTWLTSTDSSRWESLTIHPPPSVVMSQYTWMGGLSSPFTYTAYRPELASPFRKI
ncbi:hypothetical protein EYF80_028525 [Liparis tanakae]|uniref:Uncharacterized protein n=1 Tax=Liparis tanakae TaxID=230148 RepID=A0A4Z2H6U6_9TELE|nr:hypothetical protein EYF80_028525 [Liparis tanakae]